MDANEYFIWTNTKTSHKRIESMVIYPLHYQLRDVEILSQYPVPTNIQTFFVDAYVPAIKLAIEVDEPFHDNQIQLDKERQKAIEETLGCSFYRINCNESIYKQVDATVDYIRQQLIFYKIDPWVHVPRERGIQTGEYSRQNTERLEAAGIPGSMDAFAEQLEREGNLISREPVHGIPDIANGNYGFVVKRSGFVFAFYSRPSGKINVRVLDYDVPNDSGETANQLGLKPRQTRSTYPKGARYFALPDNRDGYPDQETAKKAFYALVSEIHAYFGVNQ